MIYSEVAGDNEEDRRRRRAGGWYGYSDGECFGLFLLLVLIAGSYVVGGIALWDIMHNKGRDGVNGTCVPCTNGTNGTSGGGAIDFADFYALMPGDNAATIAVGADVHFPQVGPAAVATGITQLSSTQVEIADPGIYDVSFFVSVSEAGQLELTLAGTPIANTVTGRATGTNYIAARVLITVVTPASALTVRNPAGNSAALTITPIAGGASSVSAHLTIIRLS